MALAKNKIPIPFVSGLDQKTDDKQLQIGKMSVLENAVFNKLGKISKRQGYAKLSDEIMGSTDKIEVGTFLTRFKSELNLFTGSKLYNYLDANQKWSERGELVSVKTSTRSVVKNSYNQRTPDIDTNGQITVTVWSDSRGGCRYSVFDESSNSAIVSDEELSSTGKIPRVFKIGNIFILMYYKHASTSIFYKTIKVETASSLSSETALVTDVEQAWYDAYAIENRVYFTYKGSSGGSGVVLRYINTSEVVSAEIKKTAVDAYLTSICLTTNNVTVAYTNDNSGTEELRAFTYDLDMGIEVLPDTLVSNITCDLANCRPVAVDNGGDVVKVFYENFYTISSLGACDVYYASLDQDGPVDSETIFKRNHCLVSKPFYYQNDVYLFLNHYWADNNIQPTYLLYNSAGTLLSKAYSNLAMEKYETVSSVQERSTTKVVETVTGKFKAALLKKSRLVTDNNTITFNYGVNNLQINFLADTNFNNIEISNNLHIVGGYLTMYDGSNVVEHNFTTFPDKFAYTLTGASGLDDGTYQYVILYAWIDNQGQVHRSSTSIIQEVVVSGGPKSVQLVIPTLQATSKEDVFIEVYRNEGTASGSVFYKVTSTTSPTYNNASANYITFTDNINDSNLLSREVLYTTGDILDNMAAPSCSLIKDYKGRLFVDNLDDESVVNYSKITTEGAPIEFNDSLTLPIGSKDGSVTAFGTIDDKLIIFKRSSIYVVTGDGPNNQGQQDSFTLPQLVSSDVGCVNSKSVVEVPNGIMFKSIKGIYMLDRGLSLTFIGKEVEDFNNLTITSSQLIADKNIVIFLSSEGTALVFNYLFQQWGTFTNHACVGSAMYEDRLTMLKSNGAVLQQSDDFIDNTSQINMKVTTGWLQFAEVQGFQRLYKFLILGNFKTSHTLKVKVAYDFNPAFIYEATIDSSSLSGSSFGSASPYGEDSYGGTFPLYQWEIKPTRQKCQAVKISIEDYQPDSLGEGLDLSHLLLFIGVKNGSTTTATGAKTV